MPDTPLTLADYAEAYASGRLTPPAAIREVYRRIAAHDDPSIFIMLRPEAEVIAEAEALAATGPDSLPLYGVPVAIKDNIDVAGLPTTAACPDFAYQAEQDAFVVARLRAAGALVVGKTNLDQFATGLVGVRSPYGVPRNTLRPELVPGGSSSGSAVAVAAGIVPIALGTDTAGSGRVPAGLNGIVGLKPTLGALSAGGVVPACRSLDTVSVFALTVADAWAAYAVMAGYDPADGYSRRIAVTTPGPCPPALRVGVPVGPSLRFGGDAGAAAAFQATLAMVKGFGATFRPVDLAPFFEVAALLYDGPWVAERYQAIRHHIEASPDTVLPVTRSIIGRATAFSAADAFAGQYRLADLRRGTEGLWRDIDVLVVPTFPRPRALAELEADPIGPNAELGTYTNFVNLLDLCALAVPGPPRPDGLPVGVTLIAPAGRDADLVALAARIHEGSGVTMGATGHQVPKHELAMASSDEIELVVVGAHMSGLPLNRELTALGARFLRSVTTAPDYRLFALSGGPPHRPGLLRVGAGRGHAIEAESWMLAPAAFGAFTASIPAPLGIGTLRLADGTRPKGFLVEAEGVVGAEDVSAYGGWRAYQARPATERGAA